MKNKKSVNKTTTNLDPEQVLGNVKSFVEKVSSASSAKGGIAHGAVSAGAGMGGAGMGKAGLAAVSVPHAGAMVGGAGSGYFAGKSCGLKLGLGLGGLGGPLLLAIGGGYLAYKIVKHYEFRKQT